MKLTRPARPLWLGALTALTLAALFAGLAWAQETFFTYLPVVMLQPTPTPTSTPTPTITPTPTATAIFGNPQPGSLAGTLTLCSPASVYPVGQDICVNEAIVNNNPFSVKFGLVGVAVNRIGGGGWFQTSWSSDTVQFSICPGCTGPLNGGQGPWEDRIRGFSSAGQYRLTLAICVSSYSDCASGQNNPVWFSFDNNAVTVTVQ